jgi:hypothetical protein
MFVGEIRCLPWSPSGTNTLAYYENSCITAVKSFTALASESVIQITSHKRHEIKIISGVAYLQIPILKCYNRDWNKNPPYPKKFVSGIREWILYHWPPVWLVWNQLFDYWQFLFLFAKQTNPNQSNRRSTAQWYFPLKYSQAVRLNIFTRGGA